MATQTRQQQYITEIRSAVRQFYAAYNALKDAKTEWNAQQYGDTLVNGTDANLGITKAEVGPAVFAFADALTQVMDGSGGQAVVVGSQAKNVTNLL